MFYAAVAFSLGIILANYVAFTPWVFSLTLCLFVSSALAMCSRRPRVAFFLGLMALLVLGSIQAQLQQHSQPADPDLSRFNDDIVMITGHVVRSGLLKNGDSFFRGDHPAKQEVRQTLDVETEQIVYGDPKHIMSSELGIRLTVHNGSAELPAGDDVSPELAGQTADGRPTPVFLYGERIEFPSKLREPHNYGNPGAMDYRGYLRDNGISALASVKADRIKLLPGFSGTKLGYWRSRMRRSLVDHMLAFASNRHSGKFSISPQDAGVLAAMLIGEQSLIARATREDFQRTGTYHILVVSGMNVAILAFVIFWLAKRFRASEVVAAIVTVVLSLLYAYMTDLGSPIVRAALMLSLYLGARLLYRDKFSLNSVGTAALLMLIATPQTLFEASFQLTFLSVVVLSGIVQPVLERTSAPYRQAISGLNLTGYDATLPPQLAQFRLDLRMISSRLARFVSLQWFQMIRRRSSDAETLRVRGSQWLLTSLVGAALWLFDLVLVSSTIQLALALPMVVYFHRLAMLGLPSNMIMVPLTAILMPFGIAATLLSYASRDLAAIPLAITAFVLHGITATVRHFGGMRFADVRIAQPRLTIAWLSALTVALTMIAVQSRRRIIIVAGGAVLLFGALILTVPAKPRFRPGMMELTAIDVGQGDSILIISPDGHTLLIDGGGPVGGMRSDSFDIGEDVVSPYLWSRGISHLDAIALTHAHSDHLAGLASVTANFHPNQLWVGSNPLVPAYRHLLKQAASENVFVLHHVDHDEFDFAGLHIRVLAPAANFVPGRQAKNDDSLVMEISYRNTSALLAGDIEKKVELRVATEAHHSQLLKVAHHGSATSTTPELLEAVHPDYAVISVGYKSIFGHPKPAVLARLAAAKVETYRTDLQGAVTFYLDGVKVQPAPR